MINLSLTDPELNVLQMSIKHCLDSCKDGGSHSGCPDCKTLEQVAVKITSAKAGT